MSLRATRAEWSVAKGILFSLAGDVLLMVPPDRMFLFGLVAFLLTHLSYVLGFKEGLINLTAWSLVLMIIILVNSQRVIRRLIGAMRAKGWSDRINCRGY